MKVKAVGLLALAIVCALVPLAHSQAGFVGVSPVPQLYDCYYLDLPGVFEVYVVYGGAEIDGVRFKIETSPGITMTYLSETHHAPVLEGNTQTGITFCFDELQPSFILLATIRYLGYGTSETCSEIHVVPHPDSDTIDITSAGYVGYSFGRRTIVNGEAECGPPYCGGYLYYGQPANPHDFCEPVRAEQVTWGAVKTLYR